MYVSLPLVSNTFKSKLLSFFSLKNALYFASCIVPVAVALLEKFSSIGFHKIFIISSPPFSSPVLALVISVLGAFDELGGFDEPILFVGSGVVSNLLFAPGAAAANAFLSVSAKFFNIAAFVSAGAGAGAFVSKPAASSVLSIFLWSVFVRGFILVPNASIMLSTDVFTNAFLTWLESSLEFPTPSSSFEFIVVSIILCMNVVLCFKISSVTLELSVLGNVIVLSLLSILSQYCSGILYVCLSFSIFLISFILLPLKIFSNM